MYIVENIMVGVCMCRPFFTYWVTFVQIVCYIVSVVVYGFSPIGISVKTVESEVYETAEYTVAVTSVSVKYFLVIGGCIASVSQYAKQYIYVAVF